MPLDVYNNSNTTDLLAGGAPSNAAMMRVLRMNMLPHDSTPLMTLASGRPNPSSALGPNPASLIWQPNRRRKWRSKGYFCITSSAVLGFEHGPNYNLRITDAGGTANIDCRSTPPTTHYQDPYVLADFIQAQLNAAATLTGVYTVTFSGRRTRLVSPPSDPTYKWTIACNISFSLQSKAGTDANSILPSLGFTAASYAGATTRTGESRAIHTEEYIALDLGTATWSSGVLSGLVTSRWRWLVLIDPNFQPGWTSTIGAAKTAVYVSSTATDVDDEPDSTFTVDTSFFKLTAAVGEYCDQDDRPYRTSPAGRGAGRPRYWIVDMTTRSGSVTNMTTRYLKLRVVDPTNSMGHIELGYMYVGPGWYPSKNYEYRSPHVVNARTKVERSDRGDFRKRFFPPEKVAVLSGRNWSASDMLMANYFFQGHLAYTTDGSVTAQADTGWDHQLNLAPTILLRPGTDPWSQSVSDIGLTAIFGSQELGKFTETGKGLFDLDRWEFTEEPP